MLHRKTKRICPVKEGFFFVLFLLLLFLSVWRLMELLPDAQPAFSRTSGGTPVPAAAPEARREPVILCGLETSVVSRRIDLRGKEPKILIYHTHTTEAYTATEASPYVQTGSYRTADASKSVLAVGEALAQRLRTQYGFCVIHDTTDHEPPSLKTAYDRSEKTMRAYLEKYPSLLLFIDVHRDASSDTGDYVVVGGEPTARLMCVVGQGTKYEDRPDFDRNYTFASALTESLRITDKRLARDVRIKSGRYNQHVGQLSLLIEVGHNANTLEQALHAVPFLAESLALVLAETDIAVPEDRDTSGFGRLLVPDRAGIDKE